MTRAESLMTVDAEVRLPFATAQLARFHVQGPADNIRREEELFWVDLCLTPRPNNARVCFRDHWSPNRFERIGNILMLPPGETVQARADGGTTTQSSIVCQLKQVALSEWLDAEIKWTDRRLEASLDVTSPNIRILLLRLAEELRNPGFASEVLVELLIAQLSIELARYCSSAGDADSPGGLAEWRLRLIDERLQTLEAAPTLTELAELVNLSVRQLTRGFRASRGRSIGDYVASCRIDKAKRMLGTERSVKAVAYSLGFSSPSSFSFAFRQATGETPREFRQRSWSQARSEV